MAIVEKRIICSNKMQKMKVKRRQYQAFFCCTVDCGVRYLTVD